MAQAEGAGGVGGALQLVPLPKNREFLWGLDAAYGTHYFVPLNANERLWYDKLHNDIQPTIDKAHDAVKDAFTPPVGALIGGGSVILLGVGILAAVLLLRR